MFIRSLLQKLIFKCVLSFKTDVFSDARYVEDALLFETDVSRGLSQWMFHDDNWIRIKNFFEYQKLVQAGINPTVIDNDQQPTQEVSFNDTGEMVFKGQTLNNYEWLYLYLDPAKYQWDNYSWKFRVKRGTDFRELQFAFRYQNLYNRYRVRFENNHIYFDKVVNCRFINKIDSCLFPMDLNVWYDIRLDIFENIFRCYVNGVLMLEAFDSEFSSGSIAIILWENNGKTNLEATVSAMKVNRLVSLNLRKNKDRKLV